MKKVTMLAAEHGVDEGVDLLKPLTCMDFADAVHAVVSDTHDLSQEGYDGVDLDALNVDLEAFRSSMPKVLMALKAKHKLSDTQAQGLGALMVAQLVMDHGNAAHPGVHPLLQMTYAINAIRWQVSGTALGVFTHNGVSKEDAKRNFSHFLQHGLDEPPSMKQLARHMGKLRDGTLEEDDQVVTPELQEAMRKLAKGGEFTREDIPTLRIVVEGMRKLVGEDANPAIKSKLNELEMMIGVLENLQEGDAAGIMVVTEDNPEAAAREVVRQIKERTGKDVPLAEVMQALEKGEGVIATKSPGSDFELSM